MIPVFVLKWLFGDCGGTGIRYQTERSCTCNAGKWSYSINYGPDGEEDWANLITPEGTHVANIRAHHAKRIVSALAVPPSIPAGGVREAAKVKPLDLAAILRDAFLTGRGLKDGDKLSEEDQAAWMAYDPTEHNAYKRIEALIRASLSLPAGGVAVSDACMWSDKPCTCGGGPCEQVDFGSDEGKAALSPEAKTGER